MAARYAWNSVSATVPTGNNRVQFLFANPTRVALLVTNASLVAVRIASTGGSGVQGIFATISVNAAFVLKYSDMGPLMQQDIWISHFSGGNVDVIVTEVYRLPGGCD